MHSSIHPFMTLSKCLKKEEANLQILADFYENHLCNRIFHFRVKHRVRDIKLRFKTSDFPHLIGINKVSQRPGYQGLKGFSSMQSGHLDLAHLEKTNTAGFNEILYRILYFPFVFQLINKPYALIFRPELIGSMIKAEFMLYNKFDGRFIHLGIRKEDSTEFYVAVTFVERKNRYQNMPELYIEKIADYSEADYLSNLESAAGSENKD